MNLSIYTMLEITWSPFSLFDCTKCNIGFVDSLKYVIAFTSLVRNRFIIQTYKDSYRPTFEISPIENA